MNGIRVMIVDDDLFVLEVASLYLRKAGVCVQCARSGEEALGFLREKNFHLMLTDLHMPGMDGFELVRRSQELAPLMKILMGTGDPSEGNRRTARELGIDAIFAKPFHMGEIMTIVKSLLR
ncbi:MAG: response regulator [Geobacteraceae bacterium]|nr:response regulator [Geobacteraceae bacterium]